MVTLLMTLLSHTSSSTCQKHNENSHCSAIDTNNNNNNTSNDPIKPKEKVNFFVPFVSNVQCVYIYPEQEVSLSANLLKCFSIKDNLELILSTKSSPDSVPTVNGLK